MKKNYLLMMLMVFASLGSFAQLGTDVYTLGTDNADNYSGTWGTSNVSSFSDWTFDQGTPNGGFAGRFIGPFSGDIDVNGNSFGLFANSGNDASSGASTALPKALEVGDSFKVSVGVNFRDGNKGFDLRNASNGNIINFNVASNKYNLAGTDLYSDEYAANTVITFTFTQNADNISWIADRTGGRTESQSGTITSMTPGTITNIRFYNVSAGTNNDGGSGERNLFFNSLEFTSLYTINGNSTVASNANITVPYLDVQTGSTLNIGTNSGVLVSGNLTANNNINIASGSSLRVNGSSNGNVTYNRNLATTNWYLISSPVIGQGVVDFYTNESPELGSGTGNAQNVAIAGYDNSQTDVNDRFTYYTEGQVDGLDGDDTTDTFMTGRGYSVKLNTAKDVSFTGSLNVDNVGIPITTDVNGFNLVGNPYPSFIAANNNANATHNILKVNDADNDYLTESTIWLWNGASYDIVNHTTDDASFQIAPGQGFFVSSNGSHTFSITEDMQSHQGTDTFQKSANTRTELQLVATDGTDTRDADIFYIDGTTTGFDNGYDSSIFGGVASSFSVYTEAVGNGTGKKLGIQSLPNSDLESMVIPVGVKAAAGKEITFTANATNLASGLKVYLEDRVANTFTRLDEANATYKVTLDTALNGIGRFYLHTAQKALSVNNMSVENISVYTLNAATLRIAGLSQGKTTVKLFNMLGKQVVNTSFTTNGVQDITLPKLATGVYIIQLENEGSSLNKKIVLE